MAAVSEVHTALPDLRGGAASALQSAHIPGVIAQRAPPVARQRAKLQRVRRRDMQFSPWTLVLMEASFPRTGTYCYGVRERT